jgi:NAD(P)-dependent dehydrogenase (short-subunit alcohol dehydrogenase family)
MRGLTGKVAIVTGGATSLGAAIVRAFHAEGTRAVIADIADGPGAVLAKELGEGALFQKTDVTSDAEIRACCEAAASTFGGIDFVVNCAVSFADEGLGSSRELWLSGLNIGLVGAAVMVREAAPYMKRRGGGAVVNFSSIAGKFGQRGRAIYPVTKAALRQLTASEAMELAPSKIRVNSVSPGWIWSRPIAELAKGDQAKADRIGGEYHPLGRVGRAEEVARAVLFLCSDDASFTTGADFPIDGGYAITGADQGTPRMARLGE